MNSTAAPVHAGPVSIPTAGRPIADVVLDVLVSVLMIEPHEATPHARFFQDLDGESIDLLDMGFQLQKLYGVPVEIGKQFTESVKTDEAGVVTPESLEALRATYPFLSIDRLPPSPTTETMKELLTVDAITRLVERQLDGVVGAG
ncbi:MAG: phosphopantetheine-binding protein [Phycisphaerae bacterium]